MVGTRMEGRVEEVEKSLREVQGQVSALDTKLGTLLQLVEKGEQRFDTFVTEIKAYLMKDAKGKTPESVSQTPEVTDDRRPETVPFSPLVAMGETSRETRPENFYLEEMDGGRREFYHRRLELATFTGEDPMGWVARVERYFAINGVLDQERVAATLVCFEGAALGWLQFRELSRPFRDWMKLRGEPLKRFGPSQMRTP